MYKEEISASFTNVDEFGAIMIAFEDSQTQANEQIDSAALNLRKDASLKLCFP